MEKKRCYFCEKKVGVITSFDCKCGHYFCSKHRLPETHHCIFDHQTKEREILKERILIDCNFKKIEKI